MRVQGYGPGAALPCIFCIQKTPGAVLCKSPILLGGDSPHLFFVKALCCSGAIPLTWFSFFLPLQNAKTKIHAMNINVEHPTWLPGLLHACMRHGLLLGLLHACMRHGLLLGLMHACMCNGLMLGSCMYACVVAFCWASCMHVSWPSALLLIRTNRAPPHLPTQPDPGLCSAPAPCLLTGVDLILGLNGQVWVAPAVPRNEDGSACEPEPSPSASGVPAPAAPLSLHQLQAACRVANAIRALARLYMPIFTGTIMDVAAVRGGGGGRGYGDKV